MNLSNIPQRAKALTQQRRKRVILRLRLWAGIKAIAVAPLKALTVLLLGALFIFLWNVRSIFSRPFQSSPPLLVAIFDYAVALFIPLLFLLLLAGLLYLLGLPAKARAVEDALGEIGLTSRYGHAPALISSQRVKGTSASVLTFFSLGIGLERWQAGRSEIEDALNIHLLEALAYGGRNGNNRNIIVLTAAPGTPKRREEALYDEL